MALGFQISAGTIPGRSHVGSGNLLNGRNNQDAYEVNDSEDCIVAMVHDGCGSGLHSEVGAKIGGAILCRLIVESVRKSEREELATFQSTSTLLERSRKRFSIMLRTIVSCLAPDPCECSFRETCHCHYKRFVHNYLLFTTIGIIITPARAAIFSLGDGLYALNGRVREVGPYPDNAPPYIAYSIMDETSGEDDFLRFKVHELIDTAELETALLGTDGLKELLDKEFETVPGKRQIIGHVSKLWRDDRFFDDNNHELITPWLRQLNSEVVKLNTADMRLERHLGLLPDDTTVIALRRC